MVVGLLLAVLACSLSVPRGEALRFWVFESSLTHLGLTALFLVGAYFISRWLTRNDGDVLVAFLREKLEADEVER